MHKVVIINTHGVTIVEGTQIHCMAAFNNAYKGDESPVCVYLYDDAGTMVDINYLVGQADTLYNKFKRHQAAARAEREAKQGA